MKLNKKEFYKQLSLTNRHNGFFFTIRLKEE